MIYTKGNEFLYNNNSVNIIKKSKMTKTDFYQLKIATLLNC
jgi:hypothetical protein